MEPIRLQVRQRSLLLDRRDVVFISEDGQEIEKTTTEGVVSRIERYVNRKMRGIARVHGRAQLLQALRQYNSPKDGYTQFNVATGEVQGLLTPDRPAPIFARFLEDLIASVPDAKKIHVVLDNLNTHMHHDACGVVAAASDVTYDPDLFKTMPERGEFLMSAKHRVVFHFTPKHASWLNQIEIWFSVLSRKLLNRESYASLRALRASIRRFISYYNRHLAHPYRWTYTGTPCRA